VHIFLECPITSQLWTWLAKGSDQHIDLSSGINLVLGSNRNGSKLGKKVMNAAIIHIIWSIWLERNARYFNSQQTSMSTLFHGILAEVQLSFKLSLVKGSSQMTDYKISRLFGIPLKASRIITVQEVNWTPPPDNTIKFNCVQLWGIPLMVLSVL